MPPARSWRTIDLAIIDYMRSLGVPPTSLGVRQFFRNHPEVTIDRKEIHIVLKLRDNAGK